MEIGKESIDLGIMVRDIDACRGFYGEDLGLPFEAELPMGGGTTMYRYRIGTTVLKLSKTAEELPASPVGMRAQSGIRYFTITVKNIEQVVSHLTGKGHTFAISLREIRPGVWIAILPDPDGNMVELLENRS
ncbi:MAG: VOC family protein [Dehalococcoidia bacterium]